MKKLSFLSLMILLCAFKADDAARDKALRSLVEAERRFAAASVEKGIRTAFLEYLAADAIVFLPEPVNGPQGYSSQLESDAKLNWYPAYADISSSLDWGYTTGPYEFSTNPDDKNPAGAGFYLSVWKRQPDGQWKVAIDHGTTYPVELIKPEAYQPAGKSETGAGTVQDLLARDTQQVQPYQDETLIYRTDQYPVRYRDLSIEPAANIFYTTIGYDVSPAADMAYTYGSYTRGKESHEETGYYLKVWKVLDQQWQLAAHNLVPNRKP